MLKFETLGKQLTYWFYNNLFFYLIFFVLKPFSVTSNSDEDVSTYYNVKSFPLFFEKLKN